MDGPFETLIISDNYDSNVQTKSFFDAYVRDYYTEVAGGCMPAASTWRYTWTAKAGACSAGWPSAEWIVRMRSRRSRCSP